MSSGRLGAAGAAAGVATRESDTAVEVPSDFVHLFRIQEAEGQLIQLMSQRLVEVS